MKDFAKYQLPNAAAQKVKAGDGQGEEPTSPPSPPEPPPVA